MTAYPCPLDHHSSVRERRNGVSTDDVDPPEKGFTEYLTCMRGCHDNLQDEENLEHVKLLFDPLIPCIERAEPGQALCYI